MKNTVQLPQEFILEAFLPYRLSLLSNTVSQGISKVYRKEHGLSVTEWRVVAVLGRVPGLTASGIMLRTAMDKVAISRAVNKLQGKGLVERSPHHQDRRRLPLKLTASSGVQLFNKVVPGAQAYERQLLSALSDEEMKRFNQLLGKLQCAATELNRNEPSA